MNVGVLALQGGYDAHARVLRALGHRVSEVRYADDFASLDGLVLPGGESSTMLKLLAGQGLEPVLDAFVRSNKPVLATCAGLILSAREVTGPTQRSFGWLDVSVARNAWGRQVQSFEARTDDDRMGMLFIRAPRITRVGPEVEVTARYRGEPVCIRQGTVTGATFHPELVGDPTMHREVFG